MAVSSLSKKSKKIKQQRPHTLSLNVELPLGSGSPGFPNEFYPQEPKGYSPYEAEVEFHSLLRKT